MLILLLKLTLLLSIPLVSLPFMSRASAAMRHLLCAITLGGALMLPLTLINRSLVIVVPIGAMFRASALPGAAAVAGRTGLAPLLYTLWALGAALLLARLALGYRRIAAIIREAVPAGEYSVADVAVPMVSGLLNPAILMPQYAASWPAEQRTAALSHERAHIERHDLLTGLMAHLACALYWFHPLVWAVAREMRREQETACDDAVIHSGFAPVVYAEALVATARQFTSTSLIGCHMLTQKTLKVRIARVLSGSFSRVSSKTSLRRMALIFAATIAAVALLNADEPYSVGSGVAAPRVVFKIDPNYTEEARTAKLEGSVVLSVVVGTDGLAHQINVKTSLDPGLDVKAVEAVQKWRFAPGTLEGNAVPVRATIELRFKLL